jgi:uncharacterized protein (UPF0248 family)
LNLRGNTRPKKDTGQYAVSARVIRGKSDERSVKTVRSVLNGLRWRSDRDFSLVEVRYIHRGVPGDIASVHGEDIIALEPWMMVIRRPPGAGGQSPGSGGPVPGQAAIPYHRIVRIFHDGIMVFERAAKAPGSAERREQG